MFNLQTLTGHVSRIAERAAEDDINSDSRFLSGRKLSIKIHDSNYSGFLNIMGGLQFMETNVVAIIGPQNSGMAHLFSHLANKLHIPMLSFTALDPTLSPLQYPYFVQTAFNDLFQMTAIADIISYYSWSEVIVVYSDNDEQNWSKIAILNDQLALRRIRISYKAVLPPDSSTTRNDVEAELVKILDLESRVIVLHVFSMVGQLVLDVANGLGMMESGFAWIATTWLATMLDSTLFGSTNAKSVQGFITLRPHTPDSERKRNFMSRWNRLSNGSVGINSIALYAYDTVWIIARAVKLFLDEGNNISFSKCSKLSNLGRGPLNLVGLSKLDGGSKLLQNILNTNMTGLTGPISFGKDRSLPFPAYDIINVWGKENRLIGYWTSPSGLSVASPEEVYAKPSNHSVLNQHLLSVVWPGGGTTRPRGWVFPHNGRQLRIGIPRRVSYQNFVTVGNGSDAKGFWIDLFLAATKVLPYSVSYKFIPFGDGHRNPSYHELVTQITAGAFDAVVGDVAIVANRLKIVDFTHPYFESDLVVVAPLKKLHLVGWEFLKPFSPLMWAVIVSFFLVVGVVLWILEHKVNDEFRGPPRKQVVTVIWFSFTTMFFVHGQNTISTLGRIVLLVWLFVVLIINSSYTASLASSLTVQQLTSPITSIFTLLTSHHRIGFQVGSFAETYLYQELDIAKSRLVALNSPEEYAEALRNGTVAAVVDETPYMDLFLSKYCGFAISGEALTKSGWGFAFPRDSPLAIDVSTAIHKLSENDELWKNQERWLSDNICSRLNNSNSDQLRFQSFRGLFSVCGIVCFLALWIHFCILVRQFKRNAPRDATSCGQSSSNSRWLCSFLAFASEKENVPKRKSKRKRGDMVMGDIDNVKARISFTVSSRNRKDVSAQS